MVASRPGAVVALLRHCPQIELTIVMTETLVESC